MKTIEEFSKTIGLKYLPTSEQADVIMYPVWVKENEVAAPLLVVAGAGSGKTETMSLRAAYIAGSTQTKNSDILGLTFTRKAASELSERLTERLVRLRANMGVKTDEFDDIPTATTYNSFALDVVREFGALIGIDTGFRHLDGAASWQLMHDIVLGWEDKIEGDRSGSAVTESALSLREDIWNQGMTLDEARLQLDKLDNLFEEESVARKNKLPAFIRSGYEANGVRRQLLEMIERFEEEKALLRRLDFADQVILAARIVKESEHARTVLRKRYPVVFLDEFQDTSVAQMAFLSTVFSNHPVTAVGDPNQAIYGWRGASAASLDDFHRLFSTSPKTPKTVLKLSKAWRNGTKILSVANKISEPLRANVSHIVGPDLQPPKGAHGGFTHGRYSLSFTDQISDIVTFVRKCRKELEPRDGHTASVAVLSRRRMPLMAVVDALRQEGIPAEAIGTNSLLIHPAVVDLRAALEITTNIAKSAALLRLLANHDIGAADLAQLGKLASRLAHEFSQQSHPSVLLLEAVDACEELTVEATGLTSMAYERIRRLSLQLRHLRRWRGASVTEQVQAARRIFAFEEEALATGSALDIVEALDGFERAAFDYESGDIASTMDGFLGWLKAVEEKDQGLSIPSTQADPNAVQVMTVHASKGLEWDAVAVIDLESGIFPSFSSSPGKKLPNGLIERPPSPPKSSAWWRQPGKLPYPLRRDAEYLPGIDLWGHNAKAGEFEANFKENAGAYALGEERRLAYVAVTRPRFRLGLFGSWVTSKTRRYKSTFLEETEDQLSDWNEAQCPTQEEAEEIAKAEESNPFPRHPGKMRSEISLSAIKVKEEIDLVSTGDTDKELEASLAVVLDADRRGEVNALLRNHEQLAAQHTKGALQRVLDEAKRNVSGPWILPATSVSGMVNDHDVWVDIRRPVPVEPSESAILGSAFHLWVESDLRKLAAGPAESASSESSILDYFGEESDLSQGLTGKQRETLVRLQKNFRKVAFLSSVRAVALEWPFTVALEGLMVRGRIDAVFERSGSGEYFLVDWKTGRPPRLTSEETVRRHLTQLSLYKRAWEQHLVDKTKTEASMVFLGGSSPVVVSEQELRLAYKSLTHQDWDLDALIAALASELNG